MGFAVGAGVGVGVAVGFAVASVPGFAVGVAGSFVGVLSAPLVKVFCSSTGGVLSEPAAGVLFSVSAVGVLSVVLHAGVRFSVSSVGVLSVLPARMPDVLPDGVPAELLQPASTDIISSTAASNNINFCFPFTNITPSKTIIMCIQHKKVPILY